MDPFLITLGSRVYGGGSNRRPKSGQSRHFSYHLGQRVPDTSDQSAQCRRHVARSSAKSDHYGSKWIHFWSLLGRVSTVVPQIGVPNRGKVVTFRTIWGNVSPIRAIKAPSAEDTLPGPAPKVTIMDQNGSIFGHSWVACLRWSLK